MTNDVNANGNNWWALLNLRRLPARLTTEQTAQRLGAQPHDIPVLVKAKLLTPLGGGAKNTVKYFAAAELEQHCQDRKWLDRMTKALRRKTSHSDKLEATGEEA